MSSEESPNLQLPYLMAAQAQKHVTHNEAIRGLDAIVQLAVVDRDLTSPPLSPLDGDRYVVAANPTGAWLGQAGNVAAWQDGAWLFYQPRTGWLAWIVDEGKAVVFDGAAWIDVAGGGGVGDHGALTGLADDDHLQYHTDARGDARYTPLNPSTLGINAAADTTNRLALSSAASLFNHAGAGHQQKINKSAAADTASLLFQTGFSARAELGTTGDDNFHFKVSANGSTWNEAIHIDAATGEVTLPNTPGTGGGEANTASNVNVGGVGVFKQKSGVNLEFRGLNAGSSKISVTLDGPNNEIDLDVAEANLTLGNLGGAIDLGGAKASGTLAAGRFPALSGDVTTTAGALGTTIANDAVSNAKLANMATATLKGRTTAGTGDPEDLTATQATALLNAMVGDSGSGGTKGLAPAPAAGDATAGKFLHANGSWAVPPGTGGGEANTASNVNVGGVGVFKQKTGTDLEFRGINAGSSKISVTLDGPNNEIDLDVAEANLTLGNLGGAIDLGGAKASGTLAAGRFPALTGDVTTTAGALATTIAADAVSNAKLANMAANTLKGNNTGATADPADLTAAQVRTLINVADGANAYVHPNHSGDVTSVGDGATTIAAGVVTNAKLANVATQTFKGRTTAGTGSPEDLTVAQAKTLLNLAGTNSGDQTITLTGDVTGSGTASFAATIATDAVSNAKLANVATATLKGRTTAGTGDPEDLTGTQATALLDTFTSGAKGLAPASGGGTTNFLRADGSWAAPAGGGGSSTFTGLTDTPSAYTGDGGKVVRVNSGETALEFADQLPLLGVNATPDATNKLAVSSAASLFNNAGAGHQVKVNKAADTDTASFLFQTAFSGRAEFGTTGDDDFHFKVSADGSAWTEAMVINRSTGFVSFPATNFTPGIDVFTSGAKGVAPASGGGTTNFLRADGTWSPPPGAGGGEANTASNVNVGGVGVFKQKAGLDLEFRGLNAGSSKITVTLDGANNEIDLDVAEANLTLGNLGGAIDLGGAKASGTLAAGRFPALSGDVTTTAGALGTTIANDAVSNAKLANMATATLKGRTTAGTGDPEDLTATQATALLNTFTSGAKGLAPASGGGTTNFLRADGSWAAPSGGGGGSSVTRISGNSGAAGSDLTWQALTADASAITSTTPQAVMTTTGVGAGTWAFKYMIRYQSAATTNGLGLTVNHTGTTGAYVSHARHITTGGTAATGTGDQASGVNGGQMMEGKAERAINTVTTATAGVDTANSDMLIVFGGIVEVTASGDLELKVSSEVGTSSITVKAQTLLDLRKIA